jgi:Xaa-Pro aminopeptidase
VENRIAKCFKIIEKRGLDSLLLSSPDNITYLTGFRKAEGYLLLTSKKIVYFTNFIYKEEADKIKLWEVVISDKNIFSKIAKVAKKLNIKRVGYEAKHLPFLEYEKLKESMASQSINLVKTVDLVESMRAIKDKKEINLIRKAVKISLEGFEFINEIMDEAFSEKGLSIEVEKFLKLKGNSCVAFPPVVAFGKNASFPHHIPTVSQLRKEEIILIDLGARCCGYCADLTRVFFLGKIPTYLKRVYDVVKKAQELSIKKARSGMKARDLDRVAREFIDKKGLGRYFGHGLGHGIGLCVHEEPYLNPHNEELLKENMVLTIEPAVYLPGKFGVRLESMIVIKHNRAEVIDGALYR